MAIVGHLAPAEAGTCSSGYENKNKVFLTQTQKPTLAM